MNQHINMPVRIYDPLTDAMTAWLPNCSCGWHDREAWQREYFAEIAHAVHATLASLEL